MNMAYNSYQDDQPDYQEDQQRGKEKVAQGRSQRRPSYSTGHNRPTSFNGIHRRRNKRFSW